jgi:protein lifeguard
MANPQYSSVPQRDSFEQQQSYSQPPPSYQQAESSSEALLGGAPRSADDNLPDDFKASSSLNMSFARFAANCDCSLVVW